MSSICSELPCFAVTIAYVPPPCLNALIALAPSSIVLSSSSVMLAVAPGEDGSVMLITCTPLSLMDATRAYHPDPTRAMSTPCALASVPNVFPDASMPSSWIEATASGRRGSLTSTICTPCGPL